MPKDEILNLVKPNFSGKISLEEAILKRRSIRHYKDKALSKEEVSQILWAGSGITDERNNFRSVPSGGACYPLDIYAVLSEGLYLYLPEKHQLIEKRKGDLRKELTRAAWGQSFIAQAGLNIVITAIYEKITRRYGERGKQYALQESGHIAQNIHLQAVALGLGSVPIGAFSDDEVKDVLNLAKNEIPIYIIPVGYL